jgi:hypothetical protein
MAFLADGDIAHGWVGADGAGPADSDDIVVFITVAAGDHHGGEGINQGSGFEGDFHFSWQLAVVQLKYAFDFDAKIMIFPIILRRITRFCIFAH